MNWVSAVWLTAAAIAVGMMALSGGLFEISWYAFAVGPPVFIAVSVGMPLILGVLDRRKVAREKDVRRDRQHHWSYRR